MSPVRPQAEESDQNTRSKVVSSASVFVETLIFAFLVLRSRWQRSDVRRGAIGRIETRTVKGLACLRFFLSIALSVNPLRADRILANHRFAKIERDVIARGVFTSVSDLRRKLMTYIRAYAKRARPIRWTYTNPKRRIPLNESLGRPSSVPRTVSLSECSM